MIQSRQTRAQGEGAGIGVRVAVYPEGGIPEITEMAAANPRAATIKFTKLVMDKIREQKGRVPEGAVREVIENLIHAGYEGVVISVLETGNSVRVSDRGPGISNKERAVEFGFSGASQTAAREIRGVGAGLGIARAAAEKAGGTLTIEDNIGGGTVATISVPVGEKDAETREQTAKASTPRRYPDAVPRMNISERQQKVLITVLECGEIGPSTVAEGLEISVSTAYRDLSVLEEHGLVACEESGKRVVTPLGRDLVEAIVATWVK
jgi:DNA-binding transcriptional ArsR family regulator/anti-sigma regulatory factor (Ser/Thr protein kinase)